MAGPYLGDYAEDATVDFMWDSNDSNGASITRATNGTISVYKANGTTQSVAGVTDTEDFDTLTGIHHVRIDTSADVFYAIANDYMVVLSAATIDGQTVNAVLAHFSIENRYSSVPAGLRDDLWDEPLAAHTTNDTPGDVLNMLTQDTVTLSTDVALGSIMGQLLDDGTAWSYDRTADSLEAQANAGGNTEIINPIFHIPPAIDVANTATVRIAIQVTNMVDDLPTTGEITPGTISIDRKAAAATSWTSVVTDAAMSEATGWIYYDEVFDSATGYARGDVVRFTFKSQAVVAGGNTFEICPAGGIYAYSLIPETNGLTTALIADAVLEELISDHTGVSGSLADVLNSVPSNVWANVMEAGAPATAQTALQWMRLIAAALFGETAATGDWSAKSIDGAKTRIAATLTSAGARSSVSTLDGS